MSVDFSLLDRSDILEVMFYPRADRSPTPRGAENIYIPVAHGVSLHARFYPTSPALPTILFFHGNGEVVGDYDGLAPIYHEFGLNLFVADYRGYGRSTGRPSFTSMLADAHEVKSAFRAHLEAAGFTRGCYLMGRSLGALSAVELAVNAPDGFGGLILESGAAGIRGWSRFARFDDDPAVWKALEEAQRARLSSITMPVLSIHGALDDLIPVERAVEAQAVIGSDDKEMLVIPQAGHNDLLAVGLEPYFDALAAFIAQHERRS
jgi:uncharacterized protein